MYPLGISLILLNWRPSHDYSTATTTRCSGASPATTSQATNKNCSFHCRIDRPDSGRAYSLVVVLTIVLAYYQQRYESVRPHSIRCQHTCVGQHARERVYGSADRSSYPGKRE